MRPTPDHPAVLPLLLNAAGIDKSVGVQPLFLPRFAPTPHPPPTLCGIDSTDKGLGFRV